MNDEEKVTDCDLEQIAELIKQGYTSGRLDDGEGKHVSWEIKMEAWKD